jgi:hypothetical protein
MNNDKINKESKLSKVKFDLISVNDNRKYRKIYGYFRFLLIKSLNNIAADRIIKKVMALK